MITLTCAQSRQLDRLAVEKYGVPSIVLMENAGRGLTDLLCQQAPQSVVICCGKGNNGGDGFVMARHLNLRNVPVEVFALGKPEEYKGDALTNLQIIQNLHIKLQFISDAHTALEIMPPVLEKSDWIVDALLGTGTHGAPRTPFDAVINLINKQNKKVLAVDIPSGLEADSGQYTICCVRADLTGSMGAIKTGLINANPDLVGRIYTIDIGIFPNDAL